MWCSGSGVGSLLDGRLVLEVAYPNMAVQRRAVVDLQPADLDVAAEPGVSAQGQLVARRDLAFDLALQRHVRAFEQRLDVGAVRDVDVARHAQLALDAAVRVHRAVVDELAFENVSRTHLKLLFPVALDLTVLSRSRSFRHRILDVHPSPTTWDSGAKR